ncbi:hypothetical protein ACFV6E_04110 [Streptomyces sp. NPDC059785]|uniref:hypothetical protein n=1 Tax=unclassified Streptomyces TaxID=2593676 RepID=UPI00365F7AAD
MRRHHPPAEAHAAAQAVCGSGMTLTPVSNRRDGGVWRAAGPLGSVAVKVGTGPQGALVAAREASVLRAGFAGSDAVLGHGRREGAAWTITPWYEGPSTWDALSALRRSEGDTAVAKRHVIDLCDAVAELHATGWVHGGLQPQHSLHTAKGVRFINCAWAWHPFRLAPSGLFTGGLPHLLAPEVARSVHNGDRPVAPSRSAEVYTVTAGLWWAITGEWPLNYAALDLDQVELAPSELRHRIATCRIPLRGPWMWPSVQDVLSVVLTAPPAERPTAADLASDLRGAL